jgi:hypothetical protein
MTIWYDKSTLVLVEFLELPLDSCCAHQSWWELTDPFAGGRYQFRVEGPLEFVPRLEPEFDTQQATPAMVEAWERFCAHHAPLAELTAVAS